MNRTATATFVMLALALTFTACRDGNLGPTDSALAPSEVAPVARAVMYRFGALSGDSERSAQHVGPRDSVTVVLNDELTEPCDGDHGVARLAKTLRSRVDAETESGAAEADLVLSLTECLTDTDGAGQFTLTSDPDLRIHAAFEIANGKPVDGAIEARMSGAFTWRQASRMGRCTVDLTVTESVDAVRVRGEFCGSAVDLAI